MADKMFQKVSVVITLTAFLLTGCSQSDSQVLEALPSLLSNSSVKLSECTAETENGYYNLDMVFEGKANITYIDYASKKEIFLCEQPGCLHRTDSCRSCLPLDESLALPALFVVNDSLLLLQTGASATKPPNIEIANKDGSERRLLAQFPSDYVFTGKIYTDQHFLYLLAEQIDAKIGESTKKIICIDLTDGTVKNLYDYPPNVPTPYIAGALNQNLVLASLLTDSDGTIFQEYRIFDVKSGTMANHALTLFNIHDSGSFMQGDCLYEVAYSEQKIHITNLRTGSITDVDYSPIIQTLKTPIDNSAVAVFSLDETLLRIEISSADPSLGGFYEYLLDIESGEYRPFTLLKKYNQDVVTVLGSYEDYLLIRKDWIMSRKTAQEGMPLIGFMPQYAFISAENFKNSKAQYTPIESDVYPSVWNECNVK